MGGLETYVRRLVPAMAELRPELEISVFVSEAGRELLAAEPWAGAVELITHPLLGRPGTRALTETTLLGALASRRRLDVLHSVALTAPFRTRALNVVTIADVTWLRQPDPAELGTIRMWRLVVPRIAHRADRLITLSESARGEIAEDFGIAPERIDVIACGPGVETQAEPTPEAELRTELGLGEGPIVLAVSAPKVHKNIGALIEAMLAVRKARADAMLVIPGNPTPHRDELAAQAAALGLGEVVRFPGWVSDSQLEGLYRWAACFAFPSLREGFGMPVLEAMRRGLPVACSNASAVPEVAGDAALYFDPRSPSAIAEAIVRILDDDELAKRLAAAGLERAALFTWTRAAEETLASYERARP